MLLMDLNSAILGTQVIEVFERGLHNSGKAKKAAVVPFKDLLTPSTVSAVDKYGSFKTPSHAQGGSFLYPSSKYARSKEYQNSQRCKFSEEKIINLFSNFTSDTLHTNLTALNNQMIASEISNGSRNRVWNKIMTEYLPPVAKGNLIRKIEQWADTNNVQIRLNKRVTWTAEEEEQVRAFPDRRSVTRVGNKTLEQTKRKYDNLSQGVGNKKNKKTDDAGESKKKKKKGKRAN